MSWSCPRFNQVPWLLQTHIVLKLRIWKKKNTYNKINTSVQNIWKLCSGITTGWKLQNVLYSQLRKESHTYKFREREWEKEWRWERGMGRNRQADISTHRDTDTHIHVFVHLSLTQTLWLITLLWCQAKIHSLEKNGKLDILRLYACYANVALSYRPNGEA